jgi:hypothetical protein
VIVPHKAVAGFGVQVNVPQAPESAMTGGGVGAHRLDTHDSPPSPHPPHPMGTPHVSAPMIPQAPSHGGGAQCCTGGSKLVLMHSSPLGQCVPQISVAPHVSV